jgi:hypothetical protein
MAVCKNCGNKFHFCASCGNDGYSEHDYCSQNCKDASDHHNEAINNAKEFYESLTDKQKIQIDQIMVDYCTFENEIDNILML